MPDDSRYRPCVGMMVLNHEGHVFVGTRLDQHSSPAWQMPQGGIDEGESPLDAALRELKEEIGTDKVTVLADAGKWLSYDLPNPLQKKTWGGQYLGQRQMWFLMRFMGRDCDINIQTYQPEFRSWQWAPHGRLVDLVIPFKRPLYQDVIAAFAAHLPQG